ncbi:hypothetical protein HMN09_00318100 [Mycena chlorophos]|uniref:Uncharacterized protein n=1 Tax=Mycena chlorophos TaxID=658473 RepID=A0A8H6TJX5_MYCCL|nr:hypothetical protein HMN09_00318100 [Mycena chlorophos]
MALNLQTHKPMLAQATPADTHPAPNAYLTRVLCSICGADTGTTIEHSMPKAPVSMSHKGLRCVECTRKWVSKRWLGVAEEPAAGSFVKHEQVEVETNLTSQKCSTTHS